MRLMIVIHSLAGGGAERVSAAIANYWAKREVEVSIVTFDPGQTYVLDPRVRYRCLDLPALLDQPLGVRVLNGLKRLFRLRREIREAKPTAVLGMMSTSAVLVALAGFALKARTIGSERIYPPSLPMGWLRGLVRRFAYGLLDVLTVQTGATAAWARSATAARDIRVVPNAVIWPLPAQLPTVDPQAECGSSKVVLGVGRLDSQKGFDILIRAFAAAAARRPDWILVILGQGREQAVLEAQALASGLGDRIRILGRVGNLADWYPRADLYAMTSRFEGFPNTLMEAMSHGVACVSFDCLTGPSELITDGIDGALIAAGAEDQFAEALGKLMDDPDLRRRYASAAEQVKYRFSEERVMALWQEVLDAN